MTQQLNENPLIAALFGALVGMGLEKEKAKKAAAQAVDQAKKNPAPAPAKDYSAVMRRGSRGEGVKQLQQKLGIRQVDGIFGPATERRVKQFQQSQGLQVDGVVGPETKARIEKLANAGAIQGESVMTSKNQINEEVTISGDAESLIRMMQLAGAGNAKEVDADDISQGPKPCSACGKVHGEHGCGNRNGDLARSIELMADEDWDNSPDEDVKDFEATPPTNDLNKAKKSYAPTAGGDNPMALEDELRTKLQAALEEKKSPAGGPACWDGKKIHPTKPTKMKGGKRVNNCIDADSSDGK
jgi:hypothetical protein